MTTVLSSYSSIGAEVGVIPYHEHLDSYEVRIKSGKVIPCGKHVVGNSVPVCGASVVVKSYH